MIFSLSHPHFHSQVPADLADLRLQQSAHLKWWRRTFFNLPLSLFQMLHSHCRPSPCWECVLLFRSCRPPAPTFVHDASRPTVHNFKIPFCPPPPRPTLPALLFCRPAGPATAHQGNRFPTQLLRPSCSRHVALMQCLLTPAFALLSIAPIPSNSSAGFFSS